MIRKLTAYGFILIANTVLLAHAVIPHHHHHLQVCLERTHCGDNEAAHAHDTSSQGHQHNRNTDSTKCILKQAFVIPSTQERILKDCDNCTDNHNHDYYILSNLGYEDLQPVSVTVATIPEFHSFLISFVTTSLGLRAPPIA